MHHVNPLFRRFAEVIARASGLPWTFLTALTLIVVWALSGPFFGFSDTWQLVINTTTTIVTFLMVFLIQNTQNRDAKALHLKLDELLRGVSGARTSLVQLELLSDEELDHLETQFAKLHSKGRHAHHDAGDDTPGARAKRQAAPARQSAKRNGRSRKPAPRTRG